MKKIFDFRDFTRDDFEFLVSSFDLDKDFEEHSHTYSELVIILGGTCRHLVNRKEYFIKAGDVFVFNPGTMHAFKDVRSLTLCNISYTNKIWNYFPRDIKQLPGFQTLFVLAPSMNETDFKCHLSLSMKDLNSVRNLIEIMVQEFFSETPGYQSVVVSRFMQMVVQLCRVYNNKKVRGPHDSILHLANAVSYLEKNFKQPVTLTRLAEISCLSKRQFIRVFQKNYDCTPIEHLIRLRIEYAANLLRTTDRSITQAALESGFPDSNYFSRQFKRILGHSPRAYRHTRSQ